MKPFLTDKTCPERIRTPAPPAVFGLPVRTLSIASRWCSPATGALLALVLPMHSLEPFLLILSSVFVPLFGVILGRLSFGGFRAPVQQANVHALPVALWLGGIALYHALAAWAPIAGSAIPTLLVTFVLAFATRSRVKA